MQTELATNPGEANSPAPGVADTTPQTTTDPEQTDALAETQVDPQAQLDDSEEVEYEGNRYKVPKAVAPALLRQADYTKKTQEVAELRKATEADKARIAEEAKAFQEDRQEHVQAYALWQQLEQFKNLNWQQLKEQDFIQYQETVNQFTMLRDAHRDVLGRLNAKQSQRKSAAEAAQATLRDQTRATLAREIPNWTPQREQEFTDYAIKAAGYKAEEVQAALHTDPRPFRILHKAMLYDQIVEKQRLAAKAQNPAEPVKAIGGRAAPPSGLHDKLSTAEWVKRRNAQLARKA